MENTKKIRVGIIGAGYMGRLHIQKYSLMEDVNLTGIVDTDRSRVLKIAREFTISHHSNYKELFGRVDAVSIATPTDTHFEIAKSCLKRGIHVMLEKPISENTYQADELIQLSKKNKLIMQIGHIEQFNPVLLSVRDKIQNPLFFESHRFSTFKNRNTKSSVILDLMIHDLELAFSFIKADIKNIHAAGTSIISGEIDIANAHITFSNGASASIRASRVASKDSRKVVLLQEKNFISIDLINFNATLTHKHKTNQSNTMPSILVEKLVVAKNDQLNEQLKAFINSVRTLCEPIVTGQVARNALDIALLVEKNINCNLQKIYEK